jgi:hypothetical protein
MPIDNTFQDPFQIRFTKLPYDTMTILYYSDKMQKTKIIIALATVAILTLTVAGLASAQISASQTYAEKNPNNGFWGWTGNCFGLRNN